jgi:hypothetical protein
MAALILRHATQAQLEDMLAQALANLARNKTVISYTEAGRTVTKQEQMRIEAYIDEINAALELKDPDKYTPLMTTTRVSFSAGNDGGGV